MPLGSGLSSSASLSVAVLRAGCLVAEGRTDEVLGGADPLALFRAREPGA